MNDDRRVRVDIDTNLCVGSGTCAMIDPDHFRLVDGKAHVMTEEVTLTDELEDAVLDCPVQALQHSDA